MAGPHKAAPASAVLRRPLVLPLMLLAITTAAPPLAAEEQNWLPPGSATSIPWAPPAELIRPDAPHDRQWLYGRLLFRSSALLSERAVRIGLSCNSCHTNGDRNPGFYIEGLSDRPGRIDVTHGFWKAGSEDGISNPLDIPSLRGVRDTAPYGTAFVTPDLATFTRHVIVKEFAGPPPDAADIDALIHYMKSLDTPRADDTDVLAAAAPPDDLSYLSLLEAPLTAGDFRSLDRLSDLIRSDLGSRVPAGEPVSAAILREVALLDAIHEIAAAGDFAAALHLYRTYDAGQ